MIERASVNRKIADYRKRGRPERLDRDVFTVLELAHVELARGGTPLFAVRDTVDGEAARAANTFPAIAFERDGFLTLADQSLVDDIEHLEKRRVLAYTNEVRLERARPPITILAPDLEREIQVFRHRLESPHLYER